MRAGLSMLEAGLGAILDRAWLRFAALILVALVVIVPGQATLPVTDRDEARFVQASKQMLESGDLIDIRFQDQPRWKKPVGIYWLQAASASVLGEGTASAIWAYRVPSALAGLLAAVLTAWAARPMIGGRAAALAGLMMATTVLLAAEANIAKTDAALLASAVAVLGALSHLLLGKAGWGAALVLWLAVSASILLKGPIVPVIAVLALLWVWIAGRSMPAFGRLRLLPGLALTLVLVAPWLIAIWQVSDGAFFAEALGKDMGSKLVAGQEKHWGPPGLYLALVWGTLWPWAALIPLAAPALWARRREPWLRLLAGWVIPFWIIVEIVPTKLPHYVLPLYPALLIALAAWATGPASAPGRWAPRLSAALVLLPGFGLGLAVIALPALLEGRFAWQGALLAIAGMAATALAARAALAHRPPMAQVACSVLAACLLYPAVLHVGLPGLSIATPSARMADEWHTLSACTDGPLVSIGYREPSLVFHAGTSTRFADPNALAEVAAAEPDAVFLIETRFAKLIRDSGAPGFHGSHIMRATTGPYFNYNRGKWVEAEFWTSDDPRWAPCVQ